jgi:hypothetical protein
VSGTFASLVDTDMPANFTSSLSYDANDAYLNVRISRCAQAYVIAESLRRPVLLRRVMAIFHNASPECQPSGATPTLTFP